MDVSVTDLPGCLSGDYYTCACEDVSEGISSGFASGDSMPNRQLAILAQGGRKVGLYKPLCSVHQHSSSLAYLLLSV